jgi:hypothetical protein
MSKLGDVVFCVDCDRVRAAHTGSAAAGFAGSAVDQPPRRMATKRDANGEPLCAACLDARHDSRHAKFMSHEARSPLAGRGPDATRAADPGPLVLQSSRFIRVLRTREPMVDATPPQPSKPKTARPASKPVAAPPPKAPSRRVEQRFAMLVVELGFPRAQQLIEGLDSGGRKLDRSAARVVAASRVARKKRARRN